jgi:polyphosphate kinase 2 (PPK2 family)
VSKDEQRKRLLKRIDDKEKNWKFEAGDLKERAAWDQYMDAYSKMLTKTSTDYAHGTSFLPTTNGSCAMPWVRSSITGWKS